MPPDADVAPLRFTAVGVPAPQGSKRHIGKGVMVESSKLLKPWRDTVTTAVLEALAAQGRGMPFGHGVPCVVEAVFYLPPTVAAQKAYDRGRITVPAARNDVDKLSRGLLDAITGVAIWDDGQVVELHASKRYALGRPPGADVTVSAWDESGRQVRRLGGALLDAALSTGFATLGAGG